MSLREQAKQSLPRVLRTSFSQANAIDLEREQFEREQLNAITKALSIIESPVKEKHVRTIIIGTFKQKSSGFLWTLVSSKAPLHGNPIVCWKFCCILHKVLRDGHGRAVPEATRHIGLLEDLGKLWGHLKEGYGRLISLYCSLLVTKLKFHKKYEAFPGSLAMDKDELLKAGNNDGGIFYEMCIEFLDYLEDLLNLQKGIFDSLDMSKSNSMTNSGQCRLAPLIICIQDSAHLYDYSVKIIFLLHQHLPPDTLSGHTSRFLMLFPQLRKFYSTCTSLQYFKHLVQVPGLPDQPPNFLVAAELRQHVTPVAVVPEPVEDPEPDTSDSLIPIADDKDRYIDQLLAEVENLQLRVTQLEDEKRRLELVLGEAHDAISVERSASQRLRAELGAAQAEQSALTAMVNQQQQLQEQDKNKGIEEKFNKLKEVYQKLREEHINLLRKKAEVDKLLASANISKQEALTKQEDMQAKVEDTMRKMNVARAELSDNKDEQEIQVHNMQASLATIMSKLNAAQQDAKTREDREKELEGQVMQLESDLVNAKLKLSSAQENKHNVEEEMVDLTTQLKTAESQVEELRLYQEELTGSDGRRQQELAAAQQLLDLYKKNEENCFTAGVDIAMSIVDNDTSREDMQSTAAMIEMLSSTCSSTVAALDKSWPEQTWQQIMLLNEMSRAISLAWGLARGVANSGQCTDIDLSSSLMDEADVLRSEATLCLVAVKNRSSPNIIKDKMDSISCILKKLQSQGERIAHSLEEEKDLADLVAMEISAMDAAIEEAARRMEELIAESRSKDEGKKLEVNSKILDSCTSLVAAVKELVKRSKVLQKEILSETGSGGDAAADKEFYRKNSRWTEGLLSAGKAVGLSAKLLMDAADRVVLGSGKLEEIMAASTDISASTAQLVIASRVKAREGSEAFELLRQASKIVSTSVGTVVATTKSFAVQLEEEELDLSKMSAHQTKTLEMEAQVHLLKLESEVEIARTRLGRIRKNIYSDYKES